MNTRPAIRVSVAIPVLNAERLLPSCLASLRRQDFAPDEVEILVADGGSRDRTVAIAGEYGCTLVPAEGMLAEAAKKACFAAAQGEYIALLDADNEIASPDWLGRAVAALERHPGALGFESYYLKHPADCRLNRFLTGCLQISDPFARAMAHMPRLVARDADGLETWELPADGGYPTGANGFIFRRELLGRLGTDPYHEAAFFPKLMRQGIRTLVKIRGCGVYHHYVTGWRDYFRKRRRAMVLYRLRRASVDGTWDRGRMRGATLGRLAWLLSMAGPLVEGATRALRTGDADWLLLAPAAAVSAAGNAAGELDFRRAASPGGGQRRAMELSGR